MGLDIRLPIGLLFVLLGGLLACFGLFGDRTIYHRSLDINVNLWWGLLMFAFGIVLLLLSRRRTAAMHSTEGSAEGRATEARERQAGLESADKK